MLAISCTSVYREPEMQVDRSAMPGANPKIWIYENSVDVARIYGKKIEGWGVCDRFFKIYVQSQLTKRPWKIRRINWVYDTTLHGEYCIHKCVVEYV